MFDELDALAELPVRQAQSVLCIDVMGASEFGNHKKDRDGLFLVRDSVANLTRIRDDEHDSERTDARGQQRRQPRSGSVHHLPIWSGGLS